MTGVYVVRTNGSNNPLKWVPILGPLRSYHHGVQFIEMHPKEEQVNMGTASRYHLQKIKLYPLNKTGNAKLVADMEYPELAEPFQKALGRSGFFAGFPPENVVEAQKVLDEQYKKSPLV